MLLWNTWSNISLSPAAALIQIQNHKPPPDSGAGLLFVSVQDPVSTVTLHFSRRHVSLCRGTCSPGVTFTFSFSEPIKTMTEHRSFLVSWAKPYWLIKKKSTLRDSRVHKKLLRLHAWKIIVQCRLLIDILIYVCILRCPNDWNLMAVCSFINVMSLNKFISNWIICALVKKRVNGLNKYSAFPKSALKALKDGS